METKVTKNQQTIICWFNRLIPIIPIIFFIFSLILINILNLEKLNSFFHSNLDWKTFKNLKIFIIMLSSFGIFFNILYLVSAILSNYQMYKQYKIQFIFLSCFGLNIFNFFFNLWIYYIYDRNNEQKFNTNKKFLINLGIRTWSTYDLVLIGLFTSLTIVLAYIEQFLPNLTNGGDIALKYLPIIIIAFVHSFFAGIIVGSISALMSLIFIPNAMIISPWSYILDYFLPMISPAISGLLRFKIKKKTNYLDYLNYVIMIVLTFLLIYLWQVLSGYFIWVTIYGPNWGNNGWTYSIIYNAIHIWIFTYPLTQILIPPILRVLTPFYQNKRYY